MTSHAVTITAMINELRTTNFLPTPNTQKATIWTCTADNVMPTGAIETMPPLSKVVYLQLMTLQSG